MRILLTVVGQEPAAAHARDDFIRTSSHTLKYKAVGQTSTMLPLLEGERCQSWDREEADVGAIAISTWWNHFEVRDSR